MAANFRRFGLTYGSHLQGVIIICTAQKHVYICTNGCRLSRTCDTGLCRPGTYICVYVYIGLCVFFSSGYQIKRNESCCSDLAVPCSGTRTVTSLSPDCSDSAIMPRAISLITLYGGHARAMGRRSRGVAQSIRGLRGCDFMVQGWLTRHSFILAEDRRFLRCTGVSRLQHPFIQY